MNVFSATGERVCRYVPVWGSVQREIKWVLALLPAIVAQLDLPWATASVPWTRRSSGSARVPPMWGPLLAASFTSREGGLDIRCTAQDMEGALSPSGAA